MDNVTSLCGCGFTEDRIIDPGFHCLPSSPQLVIFYAQLHGTLNATVSQLIEIIKKLVLARNIVLSSLIASRACGMNTEIPSEFCPGEVLFSDCAEGISSGHTTRIVPIVNSLSIFNIVTVVAVITLMALS